MFALLPAKWLVLFASLFAKLAHYGQMRKWIYVPYWHHLQEVAELVKSVDGEPKMIAAAWLHDTVEDTWVRPWMLFLLFGRRVERLVWGMTDVTKPEDGLRSDRKRIERVRLGECHADVQTIKLADVISNGKWLFTNYYKEVWLPRMRRKEGRTLRGSRFDIVYHTEAVLLLAYLTQGDHALHNLATELCEEFATRIPEASRN